MTFKGVKNGDELSIFAAEEGSKILVCFAVCVDGKQLVFKTTANHGEAIVYVAHGAFLEANARHIGPDPQKR